MTWETQLADLTPVEVGESGIAYKREDLFTPLGRGGINGTKLRQLIYLTHRAKQAGARGVLTAASVHSPQICMSAVVGRHYGLPVTVVLGATKPASAVRHESVKIAELAGATFEYTPVGFNPALQAACSRIGARRRYQGYWRLHYGITTPGDAGDAEIRDFHEVSAGQVQNLPDTARTLVITAGSCNSVTSVLWGLSRYGHGLSRVVLLGIGPTRIQWLRNRLAAIERASGEKILADYTWRCHDHLDEDTGLGPVLLEHYDLHATHWTTYQQRKPWSQDGITFHPTYEGKAMTWLDERKPSWWTPGTAFWIVGSEARYGVMKELL